jgi:hypothetical protein
MGSNTVAPVSAAAPTRRGDARALAAITVVWIAASAAVHPAGNFPINDDWSYARAVATLVGGHVWRLTDFTSMPLATQIVWGAMFCLPRGFSFEALRASTLMLGWLGGIGMYWLVREAGGEPGAALVGALTLLLCPVYFALSFTFMTDVPFAALAVWTAVATVRLQRRQRTRDLIATTLLISAATLLRQLGLLLAAGAGAALLAGGRRRGRLARVVIVVAVPAAALLAYNAFLSRIGEPWYYHRRETEWLLLLGSGGVLVKTVVTRLLQVAMYLGLFLAPPVAAFRIGPTTRRGRWLFLLIAATLGTLLITRRHAMPLVGNILFDGGLNPVMIAGADVWPTFPFAVWLLITAVAVVVAAAVTSASGEAVAVRERLGWPPRTQRAIVPIAAMLACSTAPLLVTNLFDRYLLVPLALAITLTAASVRRRSFDTGRLHPAALAVLAAVAVFDIAAVHDTFAFNRARWAAVESLLAQGVAAEAIDGGREVNGWLSYRADRTYRDAGPWWAEKARPVALLSLTPQQLRFKSMATFPFHRWLPPGWGAVYVLKPELL